MLSLIICILLLAVPQSETQVSPPEHKTALMGITEKIIQYTVSFKKYLKNDKAYQKYIRKLISKDSKSISPPKLKSIVTESVFMAGDYSMQLFQIGAESSKVVLYLPGGGYVEKAMSPHWRFADKIALGSGRTVFLASYPTAPVHTYIETFILLDALYRDLLTKYGADNIILVGDSAGAQLASQYCAAAANDSYAALLGLKIPSVKIRASALNCGLYSIDRKKDKLMQKCYFDRPEEAFSDKMDVVGNLTRDFPPSFIMTAVGDFMRDRAEPFAEELTKLGVENEVHVYGDEKNKLGHVFHCNMREPMAARCNDEECEFFRRHMK